MVVDAQSIEANVLFTTSGALVDCVDSEYCSLKAVGVSVPLVEAVVGRKIARG